jgi:hypothetical protein
MALNRDLDRPPKSTAIDFDQLGRDYARKYAAQVFCSMLKIAESEVIKNG